MTVFVCCRNAKSTFVIKNFCWIFYSDPTQKPECVEMCLILSLCLLYLSFSFFVVLVFLFLLKPVSSSFVQQKCSFVVFVIGLYLCPHVSLSLKSFSFSFIDRFCLSGPNPIKLILQPHFIQYWFQTFWLVNPKNAPQSECFNFSSNFCLLDSQGSYIIISIILSYSHVEVFSMNL